MTFQFPVPTGLIRFHGADGPALEFAPGSTADITFERVVHPLAKLPDRPDDTPECLRIEHRFADRAGTRWVFISHVPAEFLWEQLYVREAYTDRRELLERETPGSDGPWDETIVVPTIRGSDDLREFRAFRVHRPEHRGHPDVVPIFSKYLSWTARLSLVTAPLIPSIGGTAYLFVVSFEDFPGLNSLRDVSPEGQAASWQEFDLEPPFHLALPAMDLLWRPFEEPDAAEPWWRNAGRTVVCTRA